MCADGQVRLQKNEMGHDVPKGNQLWCFTCDSRLGPDAKQKNKLCPLVTEDTCQALLHFIKKAGPREVPPTPVRSWNQHISCGLSYELYATHLSIDLHRPVIIYDNKLLRLWVLQVESDDPKSSTGSTVGGETAVDFPHLLESTDSAELYR